VIGKICFDDDNGGKELSPSCYRSLRPGDAGFDPNASPYADGAAKVPGPEGSQ
jgi:hypothetical protein